MNSAVNVSSSRSCICFVTGHTRSVSSGSLLLTADARHFFDSPDYITLLQSVRYIYAQHRASVVQSANHWQSPPKLHNA